MNLAVLLDQSATRYAGLPAVCRGTETLWTFAQLRTRAAALAAALRARHAPGARIALVSENRPEIVELLFGIWAAGLVAVPVNYKLHAREVAQIVEDAGAAQVFASPDLAPALAGLPCALTVLDGPDYRAWMAPAASCAPVPWQIAPVAQDALAWLFYTSGTTGRSKGAMLTHGNLMAMSVAHLADIEPELGPQCSQLHAAPMSHGSGLYLLPSLARGARQVVPASHGFEPDDFLALCDVHPGCGAFLAPTMVQRLREALVARGGVRPRQLRCIVYGGGPMYLEELRRSMLAFGPVFAQIYGQGETPMTITGLTRDDHCSATTQVLASVGWARSGTEVAILDAQAMPLPPGQPGEVAVRGATVMAGYWRNPDATAQALPQGPGGWLYTGDIGVLDAQGCLSLRDRSKDVVISGGSNIYPREVEEVLLTHPGVAEACVVGAPDAEWSEVVVAYVVRAPGAAVDAAALDAQCLAHMARFKRPKRYTFVDTLPKNSYGKVLKRALRELPAD